MRNRQWLWVSAACFVPFVQAGCSSEEGAVADGGAGAAGSAAGGGAGAAGAAGTAQGDASAEARAGAGGASVAGDADAAAPVAFVRVANLSPGIAALDICVRPRPAAPEGGADAAAEASADAATDAADASDAGDAAAAAAAGFVGPVLKNAGIATGLAYTQVTTYVGIAPGSYDVRAVAANASDCGTAITDAPDTLGVSTGAAGAYSTFAAIGIAMPQTTPPFQVKAYADERTVAAGQTKIRFIHASPGTPNIDIGLSTAESFVLLFGNVAYSQVGTSGGIDGGIDASGYLLGPPITSQTLVGRFTGDPTDVLLVSGFALPAGSIASTFAVGITTSVTTPVKILICQDLDTSKAPLSNCVVKP